MKAKSESEVAQSCPTHQTAAYQAPPSMGFSRQEYWSGVPLPSPTLVYNIIKVSCATLIFLLLYTLQHDYHQQRFGFTAPLLEFGILIFFIFSSPDRYPSLSLHFTDDYALEKEMATHSSVLA